MSLTRAAVAAPPRAVTASPGVLTLARRGAGALLALLTVVPLYHWLATPNTGLAGQATIQMADATRDFSLAALGVAGALALLLALATPSMYAALSSPARLLANINERVFALACGLIAATGAWLFNQVALHGNPNLIDATAQLLQARYLAAGHLAGPSSAANAFWQIQQTLLTPAGWLSQYPPGHVLLLALGWRLGIVSLVGPLLLGATVYLTARTAARLWPEQSSAPRVGALLLALSPFALAHAGAYMNHTSAALCAVAAVWACVRSDFRGRGLLWAGVALGALLTIRPLTAATVGAVLIAFAALERDNRNARALVLLAIGALPFVLLTGAYNAHFFGSPFRFGYDAALGADGRLGFGVDPWGNTYGGVQALAYTSAELVSLNLQLLESAIPAVLVVALFVVWAPRLERADRLLLAWACAPLITHLFYWHHGLFMGPRMLNEYAPAWCLLVARAAQQLPRCWSERPVLARVSPRSWLESAIVVGVAALLLLGPMRLRSYAEPRSNTERALAGVSGPALVFVHGAWEERLSMRLAATGLRLDSVETAVRQNSTCAVQHYTDAREADGILPQLDWARRAENLPTRKQLSTGSLIRVDQQPWNDDCAAEARADRYGALDISRLLLHADLPGLQNAGVLVARDLGPRRNAELLRQHVGRTAYLLSVNDAHAVVLEPYAIGRARLWNRATGFPP